MSFRKEATNGMLWTFMDIALSRGVSIIASILLARILMPEDFGLMAMIYIFSTLAAVMVEGGLTQSLIRTKDANNTDYSTIFLTNLAVSIFLYAIVYLAADDIAIFYNQPKLTLLIRVYSILFILTAFSAVQIAVFSKELQFKKLMLLNIPATIIGAIVGVAMAFLKFGVWSIIGMQLSTQAVLTIMLWWFSNWKPDFVFSKSAFKFHFGFGYKLMISSILASAADNLYNILIGKFYSLKTTGQFERAYMFSNYPAILLTTVIGKVTYPILANIQNQKDQVYSVFSKIIQMVIFVSAPLMLMLSALSLPIITLVLGDKWIEAASYFQILCLTGILYPLHALHLNLIKVYGRSDWFLKLEIYKKILLAVAVFIAFFFGIKALVWSAVVTSFVALFVNVYYTNRLIGYSIITQLKDVALPLLFGVLMFISILVIQVVFSESHDVIKIITGGIGGLIVYLTCSYIFKVDALKQILNFRNLSND